MGNRIFNFSLKSLKKKPASTFRYIGLVANYDTALVSLTGNTVLGGGTGSETAMYYTAKAGARLIVTSSGNGIENIEARQFVDDRVTISSGY